MKHIETNESNDLLIGSHSIIFYFYLGQIINNLKFNKIIGKGSFGLVYEAEHINKGSKYAVKV